MKWYQTSADRIATILCRVGVILGWACIVMGMLSPVPGEAVLLRGVVLVLMCGPVLWGKRANAISYHVSGNTPEIQRQVAQIVNSAKARGLVQ